MKKATTCPYSLELRTPNHVSQHAPSNAIVVFEDSSEILSSKPFEINLNPVDANQAEIVLSEIYNKNSK